MKFLLAILSLTFALNASATNMVSPKIDFTFYSKDGVRIEGIPLYGMLSYKILTMADCSGPFCIPSLPHYKSTSESPVEVGQSNLQGSLILESKKWLASNVSAKDLYVSFYSNGVLEDLCHDGNGTYYNDALPLLPDWINGKAIERNAECMPVSIDSGSTKTIVIKCISPYTAKEIDTMRDKIITNCH